jgi:hypothetical protein
VLEAADADALDAAVGSWLDARLQAAGQAAGHARRPRRAVAVDGKAVRGTRHASADGLHTQREHAQFLVTEKQAHYILVVKKNQPGLYAQVKNLPWRRIPVAARQHGRGHGRQEHRTLKAAAVAAGLGFPHAAQAICLTRQVRPPDGGRWRTVTVYARLALEEGEVTGRGLRSLRRPARPPGSRRYRAAAHRCGRRSTAAGGLHVRGGPRPLARTG